MKKLIILAVAGLVAIGSFAQNGYFLQNSDGTIDVIASAAVVADLTASDDLTVTDDATLGGITAMTALTATATNNATITPAASVIYLSGIGGANDTTNTITLGDAVYSGQLLTIALNPATTNLITIADSAPVYLSGAWLGDAGDSITLVAPVAGTNIWIETAASDN